MDLNAIQKQMNESLSSLPVYLMLLWNWSVGAETCETGGITSALAAVKGSAFRPDHKTDPGHVAQRLGGPLSESKMLWKRETFCCCCPHLGPHVLMQSRNNSKAIPVTGCGGL
jgi:hypothetical protein